MDDLDKLEKKISSKTKLEEEKQSKLKAAELEDELDATGQEDEEKAAKWVIELEKQNEKTRKDTQDSLKEFLSDKAGFKTYEYYLARLLYKAILGSITWPKGFKWRATHNSQGVALIVKNPDGEFFSRGFKPVHHPEYDLNALSKIYWACENLIEDYEKDKAEQERNNSGDQES